MTEEQEDIWRQLTAIKRALATLEKARDEVVEMAARLEAEQGGE